MYDTYTIYTSVLWLVENMAVIWNRQYIYNNSKCSCKLWQHCIISQAVKLNDRTHTVSVAWWASRMEGNLLNETNPQNKTHFFPPEFVLCLQKWGFAASSQTSRATGEWPWMLLFPSTSHTHTHTGTLVQRYSYNHLSSIALFSCLVFMVAWAWLQEVHADLIVCILRRLIIKKVHVEWDSRWDYLTPITTPLLTSEKENIKRKSIELAVSGQKETSLLTVSIEYNFLYL